jgi:hypothetical protein
MFDRPVIGQNGVNCPMSRGAAEGLEGPAGTERLDPTLNRRSLGQRLAGSFASEPAVRE